MEDISMPIPIAKNNSSMNFSNIGHQYGYSMELNPRNEEMLKIKDEKIKMLNRKLKSYQKVNEDQSQQINAQDNLVIDYNSLNKNYLELEGELNCLRAENLRLKDSVAKKNIIISEYVKGFEDSSNKFQIFNDKNSNLKLKNDEYESKLKMLPSLLQKSNELNSKLSNYENKIDEMKEEHIKKEELFKFKYDNNERNQNITIKQYEYEIDELKNEIERIKTELENSKKQNEDLTEKDYDKGTDYDKKANDKLRENDRLANTILELKETINENNLNYENENKNSRQLIDKLQDDINNLNQDLKSRDDQIILLNEAVIEFDNAMKSSENELKSREIVINNLNEEKEKLQKQLNDKQMDFVQYQNSAQQIIDILHKKLLTLDKEKNNLFNDTTANETQISMLQEQINQFELSSQSNKNECDKIDKQYNDLVKAYEIKEKEFQDKVLQIKSISQKRKNEMETLRSKYEKKIQSLTLNNNELNSRINNLINSLIALKDYAISIERNLNEASEINAMNSSMYSTMGFTTCCGGCNNCGFSSGRDNKDSEDLIQEMKDMINRIDSKILNNNVLDQTY
jgi:chromosome segregation ATPase